MPWFVQRDSSDRGSEFEATLSPSIEVIPEERERFEQLGQAVAQQLFDAWRAQGRNPYDLSDLADEPYHPYFTPSTIAEMMEGWRWPVPDRPFRTKAKSLRPGPLVDIIGTDFGTYAISQRVIDLIEAIEPGVHRYIPWELVNPDGSVNPEQRWLLNVCTRVFSIDVERSSVQPLPNRPYFYGDKEERRIVIRHEAVEGRALWFDYRYRGANGQFLVSDELWNAISAAGCRGWTPNSNYPEQIPMSS